jgi:hypothetical protein
LEKQIALVISENKSCADKIKSTFCEDNENTKLFEDAPGNSNFMKLPSPRFLMYIFFNFWSLSCLSKKSLFIKFYRTVLTKMSLYEYFIEEKRRLKENPAIGNKRTQGLSGTVLIP